MALPPEIAAFKHELVSAVLVSIFIGGAVYPFKKIKASYTTVLGKLDAMQTELAVQRTDHLEHIEASEAEEVSLLKDVVRVLNDMHLDQRTLLGRLDK